MEGDGWRKERNMGKHERWRTKNENEMGEECKVGKMKKGEKIKGKTYAIVKVRGCEGGMEREGKER